MYFVFLKNGDSMNGKASTSQSSSELDQEIQELVARIADLETKLKSEKSHSIEIESKLE